MPKPRKKELIACQYYSWKLSMRHGVYQADGRSGNASNLGRHSLATKDKTQALIALKSLDEQMALRMNLITKEVLHQHEQPRLDLDYGLQLYTKYSTRPRIAGGVKPSSARRYKPVFDKFISFLKQKGIDSWQQVGNSILTSYTSWLDDEDYAQRTQYFELTTLKQCLKWLVQENHLTWTTRIICPLRKPQGTDAHCYSQEEVTAMVELCHAQPGLHWLERVIVALATTGLRISELASLRWSDVDLVRKQLMISDESARLHKKAAGRRRETKTSRSRSLPLHGLLLAVLTRMDRTHGGCIFTGPNGGPLKQNRLREIFVNQVITPLVSRFPNSPDEIGFKDGRLHSFRHYFCSTCANEGVPELVVMNWLGHRNSDMVKHYYHLNDQVSQLAMNRLQFFDPPGSTVLSGSPGWEDARTTGKTA